MWPGQRSWARTPAGCSGFRTDHQSASEARTEWGLAVPRLENSVFLEANAGQPPLGSTVVDQTTDEVEKLRRNLETNSDLKWLRNRLGALAISTLRGQFADNHEWSADPSRAAVICGTKFSSKI